jgi:Lrp/AsnC family transcriptional regulator, leucine-responsive regulatory protein
VKYFLPYFNLLAILPSHSLATPTFATMKGLDQIDLRILNILQLDSKHTIKEVAIHLHMTTTPVYERIRRLEDEGYIKRYVALLDSDKLDFGLTAFCRLTINEKSRQAREEFEHRIHGFGEVLECHHLAGTADYQLKVVVSDIKAYHDFVVNKLSKLVGITAIESSFVMAEIKQTTSLPIVLEE